MNAERAGTVRDRPATSVLVSEADRLAATPSSLLWRTSAACRHAGIGDAEMFFPSPGGSAAAAKAVCASCPVTVECLAFAMEHFCQGVWGGTTDNERARLRGR